MQALGNLRDSFVHVPGSPWTHLGDPLAYLWMPLGDPWHPLDTPWATPGTPLDTPWATLGTPLDTPWAPLGFPMGQYVVNNASQVVRWSPDVAEVQ